MNNGARAAERGKEAAWEELGRRLEFAQTSLMAMATAADEHERDRFVERLEGLEAASEIYARASAAAVSNEQRCGAYRNAVSSLISRDGSTRAHRAGLELALQYEAALTQHGPVA